jgi:hypothetical protein
MWTKEHRRTYRREGEGYPSDLRDAEWARLEPLIPGATPGGRPRKTNMRAAMSAILYLLRTGCRLSVALSAARRLSAPLDGLQHLPQVPARGDLGGDLGRAAYGAAPADGPRGEPLGCRSRQPIAEIGRNVWPAPSASSFREFNLSSLHQRIRSQGRTLAKMEIRASRAS